MISWEGRAAVILAAAFLACSTTTATSPDAGGGAGTSGSAGASGGAGGGTAGTSGGRGGAGGTAAPACTTGTSCDPSSSGPCGYCDRGGTLQRSCQCSSNGADGGYWNCGGYSACGSNNCGLADSTCNPRTQTTCEQCDATGARHSCRCVAEGSQGVWACASAAGSCGVSCGERRCLAGELCVVLGQYPGILPPDGGTGVILRPTCVAVPDACATTPLSCANCIISAFGCSPPGTCRDVGPETFECILGGG